MDALHSLVVILDVNVAVVGHDAELFQHAMYDTRYVVPVYVQGVLVKVSRVHLGEADVGYVIAFLVSRVKD